MAEPSVSRLNEFISAYDTSTTAETKVLLASLRSAEVANLLEAMPPKTREVLWELLDEEVQNKAL